MKIAQINMTSLGSTGKIMFHISQTVREMGYSSQTYAPIRFIRGNKTYLENIPGHLWWGSRSEHKFHYYAGTLLGMNGLFSWFGTRQLIKHLKKFSPDIIHLHNLHFFCINFPMLFRHIKKNNISVVWTLHDCWSFTGHCPHFVAIKCDKWMTGCHHCPSLKEYPKSYIDHSRAMHRLKQKWFLGVKDMTIVTPSEWLGELVKQSFLKDYPVKVINNGINLSVFKPTDSDFRVKRGCQNKHILLGVAFGWGYKKGLDVFVELSKRLPPEYQIVLVGTSEMDDEQLPDNIISIHSTNNQTELAEIYTAVDLFVQPTREDTYPTVNIESLACGTPIVTFRTGGSPEIVDETCGSVIDVDDIDAMEREIIRICEEKPYSKEDCILRASRFDMKKRFEEYVDLYREVVER